MVMGGKEVQPSIIVPVSRFMCVPFLKFFSVYFSVCRLINVSPGFVCVFYVFDLFVQLGHFLFFLCFASVQNCETYPSARRKNKQAIKNKTASACCMDVKLYKSDLSNLSAKEMLNKV
jgi:hypothetical protein